MAGKNVAEMTCFMSSGTQNLNSVGQISWHPVGSSVRMSLF